MREFTLKLGYDSLKAITDTLQSDHAFDGPHTTIVDQMMEALKVDLMIRFQKKLLMHQFEYRFKLKMHEALALKYILSLCPRLGQYEENEINELTGCIDRHYV